MQGSLPLPEDVPVRLGLQVASLFGTAGSQINTLPRSDGSSGAYGYNYLETRKYTDLLAKLRRSPTIWWLHAHSARPSPGSCAMRICGR